MTRLTDTHSNAQHPLQTAATLATPDHRETLQVSRPLTEVAPAAVAATTIRTDRLASNERLTHEAPARTTAGLPTDGEPLANSTGGRGLPQGAAESWATVFGEDGSVTNRLMRNVALLQATRNETTRGTEGLTTLTGAQRAALPAGTLRLNSDGSVRTPGGFSVLNDGDHNWRIRTPEGAEHRIWGDPHVDENHDGQHDWHFNQDASFILPDGTKIFCDTSKVGETGGAAITVSDQLRIQYGDSLGSMDVRNGGAATIGTGAEAYDRSHVDGQLFVLAEGNHFVEGRTLGDLYDAGGDFAADVDTGKTSTISAFAQIALDTSLAGSPARSMRSTHDEVRSPGLQRLPTLSEMVTNVYGDTAVRGRKPAAEAADDNSLVKLEPQHVRGVGPG